MPRFTGEVRVGFEVTVRTEAIVTTPPRRRSVRRDPAELVAGDAGDPVVPGQPLVEERVVGVEEVGDRPVVVDDRGEEQLDLAGHRQAERLVEAGEPAPVGAGQLEVPGLEPLAGEVLDELPGLRVLEHPGDLGVEVLRRPGAGPSAARSSSSSSGMLLQRKYESREASSRSVRARGAPGRVSSSTRNRKWGETRTAWMASWIPFSNRSPFFSARSTSADQAVDLGRRSAGRRKARVANCWRTSRATSRRFRWVGRRKMIVRCESGRSCGRL